jgi:hypothetical protein
LVGIWYVKSSRQRLEGDNMSRVINKILIVIGIICIWENREHIVPACITVKDTVLGVF